MSIEDELRRSIKSCRAYQKELEKYLEKMVLDVLEHEGIELSDDCSVHAVVEYLMITGDKYSIYKWIEDTKMNYPECFK